MDAMLLLKASVLLASTLAAARLLRRAPASARHRLWTLGFAAVLALPLLSFVLPALSVPVPSFLQSTDALAGLKPRPYGHSELAPATTRDISRGGAFLSAEASAPADLSAVARSAKADAAPIAHDGVGFSPNWTTPMLLLAIWLSGTAIASGMLLVSLLRAHGLVRTADDVTDPDWRGAADRLGRQLGVQRPVRLVFSVRAGTPMAGGVWRPVIFLPVTARTWSAERRDVVLAHEMAHLAERDPLRHIVARLAVAFYWFHPLSWIAARHATAAREQACDEAVLALGTRPSVYAGVLLDLAESMHPAPALGALPMVDRSLLETRLMAILNDDRRSSTGASRTVSTLVPALAVALLTLSVAAVQPSAAVVPDIALAELASPTVAPAPVHVAPVATAPAPAPAAPAALASAPASSGGVPTIPSDDVPTTLDVAQPEVDRDSACYASASDNRSFNGSMSSNAGRIYQQIGSRGADRIIQTTFGDLRVCMVAEGIGDRTNTSRPTQWPSQATRVVLEARRGSLVQRLDITRQGGNQRMTWQVGGRERAFDAAGERWRDRMLALFDATWELSSLHGEVSSLRGEISSVRGHQSSLRGEISSLRGHVSSMRGHVSSTRGHESSLRGQISSIRGHESSLRGAISSERGAISSIHGSRYYATDADRASLQKRIAQHEAAIERIERDIREYNAEARVAAVEREIQSLDFNGKVTAIEAEIRAFDLDGKVAGVEQRIKELDVEGKVAAIEKRIEALDADRRGRQLEERRDAALKQLEAAVAAVK